MNFERNKSWQSHIVYSWLILIIVLMVSADVSAETVHHELHVKLSPDQASISVIDDVQLPTNTDSAAFSLHSSFTVKARGVELKSLGDSAQGRLRHYRINRLPPDGKVQLSYEGSLSSETTQGPFDMPDLVLDTEGVYLDGGSAWVPRFETYPWLTFNLQVEAPAGWEMISQGKRKESGNSFMFNMPHLQNDVYLLGGAYQRYSRMHDDIEIVVYLYQADTELANRYLQASAEYLTLYSNWIGTYPYAKFAIVENRWQTGYGMPSFTLLGSRVMRLPFILYTSLPHEIVHNWWGNGVYLDYSNGNWSEGLTAYMSDHYNDEQQGKDREYRRKALERYANFAAEERDFALADFSARHDEASQAVGYSKSMMLFHMLRKQSGDEIFNENIRSLWRRYQFKAVNFYEVIKQLYTGDADDYAAFVEQWLERPGAPEIALADTSVKKHADGYTLTLEIIQQQAGPVYVLQVPLEVTLEGVEQPEHHPVMLTEKHSVVALNFEQRPRAITLDPDYDVFRLLHANERPSSFGRLFGAKQQLLVLPVSATAEQARAWQLLADAWTKRYNNIQLATDADLQTLPDDAAVWLLGWNNELLENYQQRFSADLHGLSGSVAMIDNRLFNAEEHAVVMLDSNNNRTPLGFIGADDPDTIISMAGKLPHYSSYGVLVFEKPELNNILKQHLPVQASSMTKRLAR